MSKSVPASKTWTLRLKQGKITVVIFADPLQSLNDLKSDLLQALKITHSNLKSLPNSINDIELARPIDPLDIERGWESVEPKRDDDDLSNESKYRKKDSTLSQLGIKENAVLAFRFSTINHDKDEENQDNEDDQDDQDNKNDWNVILPSYTDEYDVENVGDLGIQPEFKG